MLCRGRGRSTDAPGLLGSEWVAQRRVHLEKMVTRTPLGTQWEQTGPVETVNFEEEDIEHVEQIEKGLAPDKSHALDLDPHNFDEVLKAHPFALVLFYADWCSHCQQFKPVYDRAASEIHKDHNTESDGRVLVGKVNCEAEPILCMMHGVQSYPQVNIFKNGTDIIEMESGRNHIKRKYIHVYRGPRTVAHIRAFAEEVVSHIDKPAHHMERVLDDHKHAKAVTASPGCRLNGFLMVNKVPGTLHIHQSSDFHNFDHDNVNTTHFVHKFKFGKELDARQRATVEKRLQGGASKTPSKLQNRLFLSEQTNTTHEHYLQVVKTNLQPLSAKGKAAVYDYTAHAHKYESKTSLPAARVAFDFSPIQVTVTEKRKELYHFVTTLCAIIGGVFTVAGMLDSTAFAASRVMKKKVEIGKQG